MTLARSREYVRVKRKKNEGEGKEPQVTIQEAKRIPLPFVRQRLGRNPHHQKSGEIWYISPFRDEEEPSFKVNLARNVWYDFGLGKGGDGVKLMQQWTRCGDVSSALRAFAALVEGAPPPRRTPRSQPPQPAPASLGASRRFRISRVGPLENEALVPYLQKRCLSSSTAARYVREIHYAYESRNFFALAFPSRRGGFELRNRYFKGAYGPKAITVLNPRQGKVLRRWVSLKGSWISCRPLPTTKR